MKNSDNFGLQTTSNDDKTYYCGNGYHYEDNFVGISERNCE